MKNISPFEFSDKDINSMLPDFNKEQLKIDELWINQYSNITKEKLKKNIPIKSFKFNTLLPFIKVGELLINSALNAENEYNDTNKYLSSNDFPALVSFRNHSALLGHSELDQARVEQILQIGLIQLMFDLNPSIIDFTLIDLENYGSNFSLLTSSLPPSNINIISEENEFSNLLNEITKKIKENNVEKGHFDYLYEYNDQNQDNPINYHFVFISSFDKSSNQEQKKTILKFIANDNSAKAGIYFFLSNKEINSEEALLASNKNLSRVYEDKEGKIKIIDKNGINPISIQEHRYLYAESFFEDKQICRQLANIFSAHMLDKISPTIYLDLPDQSNLKKVAWKENAASGINLAIGKAKGKIQYFTLGPNLAYNAIIGGAIGSGKSTLLHGIILQASANYSPEDLNISILDYKDGTEFKIYKNLPHIYALSGGSNTRFGLEFLRHLHRELTNRFEKFNNDKVDAKDLATYRKKTSQKLPRHLVIIDEFQKLFNDKKNGEESVALLDDLIKRGRAPGFTFILSSQSLRDQQILSSTKDSFKCRVCFRLSESDAAEFLSPGNTLPQTFRDKGQAVYNVEEGDIKGNVEFRAAFYEEDKIKSYIQLIQQFSTKLKVRATDSPYIYFDDDIIEKNILKVPKSKNEIFYAYEDIVPRAFRYFSLNPKKGVIYCLGLGASRELFEENLFDEFRNLNIKFEDFTPSRIKSSMSKSFNTKYKASKVLIIRLDSKINIDVKYQDFLQSLIGETKFKIIFFGDNEVIFRNHALNIEASEVTVCFDIKSAKSYFGGQSDLKILNAGELTNYSGVESVLARIPKISAK